MSTPRRRIVRPTPIADYDDQRLQRRILQLRGRLAKERVALDRWMSRLKRAFKAMQKAQQRIARIEKQLTTHEGN